MNQRLTIGRRLMTAYVPFMWDGTLSLNDRNASSVGDARALTIPLLANK